jgi:creatinine amidohydrolase
VTVDLDRAVWPELPDRAVLLVPVGSTEQHGPHLPLGTDAWVAGAVARRVADRATARGGPPVLVAPPIGYGASGEHEHFPGTISIGHRALHLLLVELGRSACRWADRLLLVNGHGGNLPTVRDAVGQLRAEGREVAWVGCGRPGADAHAGRFETSLMLALDAGAVRLERAAAGNTAALGELMPRLQAGGVRAVSPNGVLGDPTGADRAAGDAALEDLVGDITARLLRWQPDPSGMLAG